MRKRKKAPAAMRTPATSHSSRLRFITPLLYHSIWGLRPQAPRSRWPRSQIALAKVADRVGQGRRSRWRRSRGLRPQAAVRGGAYLTGGARRRYTGAVSLWRWSGGVHVVGTRIWCDAARTQGVTFVSGADVQLR